MTVHNKLYNAVFDFLGTPLSEDELRTLGLSARSMKRLHALLVSEQNGTLTTVEEAQLAGFKEAAFYLRMAHA